MNPTPTPTPDDKITGVAGVYGSDGSFIGGDYETLSDAISAASAVGGTVVLAEDTVIDSEIDVSGDMTISLNGHTISNVKDGSRPIVVASGSTLTIDGTKAGSQLVVDNSAAYGLIEVQLGGSLVLNGGTYGGDIDDASLFRFKTGTTGDSTFTAKNVTVTTNSRVANSNNTIPSGSTLTMNVSDSNITAGDIAFFISTYDSTESTFTNVTADITAGKPVVEADGVGTTFTNCNFTVEGTNSNNYSDSCVFVGYDGVANIISGTYTSAGTAAYIGNSGGTINISGGTFSGKKYSVKADAKSGTAATVNISDGTFSGALAVGNGGGTETIAVSGGKFDAAVNAKFCATGYEPTTEADSDGMYTVSEIPPHQGGVTDSDGNVTYYDSLADAFDAAKKLSNFTISLDEDVSLASGEVLTAMTTGTFDLNGHTLAADSGNTYLIGVNNSNGNLTIVDTSEDGSGVIDATNASLGINVQTGTINFESGTLKVSDGSTGVQVIGKTVISKKQTFTLGKDAKIVCEGADGYGITLQPGTSSYNFVGDTHVTINGTLENCGVALNGTVTNSTQPPVITVGSTANISTTNWTSLYLAGYGKTTVEDGASIVCENSTGIELRAGELTVNGGTITSNATTFTEQANGSGGTTDGAGITVSQHTTGLATKATIAGGSVTGYNGLWQTNIQGNAEDAVAKVELSVTGGEFKATSADGKSVYAQNSTKFISGGTFNTSVDDTYLADGYTTELSDGIYAVKAA